MGGRLRADCCGCHQVLDKFLRVSGSSEGGDYFLGGRYSFAETVTTPFLRRSLVTLPYFKKVDPCEIIKQKGLDRIGAWIQVPKHICFWLVGRLI